MDSKGNIIPADVVAALRARVDAGDKDANKTLADLVPIEPDELALVEAMNRAQRRAWYSNKRRKRQRFGGAGPLDRGR